MRKYYEAYDERYKSIHHLGLQWAPKEPTPIVKCIIDKYNLPKHARILEIGCGEGRDTIYLYRNGYNVWGSDISKEAIDYCIALSGSKNFFQMDAVNGSLIEKYDFVFAIAVIHMLIFIEDRKNFLQFIRNHMCDNGYTLICSMGNGIEEYETDIKRAFDVVDRIHESSGRHVEVAATTCKKVNWSTFENEITKANFCIIEKGMLHDVPGFDSMMYIVAQKAPT